MLSSSGRLISSPWEEFEFESCNESDLSLMNRKSSSSSSSSSSSVMLAATLIGLLLLGTAAYTSTGHFAQSAKNDGSMFVKNSEIFGDDHIPGYLVYLKTSKTACPNTPVEYMSITPSDGKLPSTVSFTQTLPSNVNASKWAMSGRHGPPNELQLYYEFQNLETGQFLSYNTGTQKLEMIVADPLTNAHNETLWRPGFANGGILFISLVQENYYLDVSGCARFDLVRLRRLTAR